MMIDWICVQLLFSFADYITRSLNSAVQNNQLRRFSVTENGGNSPFSDMIVAGEIVNTTANASELNLCLCVPTLSLGDPAANASRIHDILKSLSSIPARPTLCLFPELCLTGKTCGDLFFQPLLLDAAEESLIKLEQSCRDFGVYAVVGLPLRLNKQLYNAAALLSPQGLLRFSLQSRPGSQGLERWFEEGMAFQKVQTVWQNRAVPVSTDAVFHEPTLSKQLLQIVVGNPLAALVNQNAVLVLNPTAEIATAPANAVTPWAEAYSYNSSAVAASCSSGPWESSTDAVYSGQGLVCKQGRILCQVKPLSFETETASCLFDISDPPVSISDNISDSTSFISSFSSLPFVNLTEPKRQCQSILDIQASALMRRLLQTGQNKVVLGISGGSDSSQALLVCVHAFNRLGLPRQGIIAVAMPGPGSSTNSQARTNNLVEAAGVTALTIPITNALENHLSDIGHRVDLFDTTYENAQARERTQILMDLSNQENALMVGTGDMSEIALGWSTFNGDHMAFYNPNAGLPKTLLLRVLAWAGAYLLGEAGGKAAKAVAEATISPELVPQQAGKAHQSTEEILGPYLVHDFYLYYGLYKRQTPRELFRQAIKVFEDLFTPKQLLTWMYTFFKRLFSQQFKRSASTDGPQLVEFSLSPRGGLVLPSDASAALWLQEINALNKELDL
jgi:NAD+ synthase (glutamine-hydrolysing)